MCSILTFDSFQSFYLRTPSRVAQNERLKIKRIK